MANNNKNRKPPVQPAEPMTRLQRMLTFVGGSVLGVGVISIFVLLLGESLTPVSVSNDSGIWSIIAFIPDIAIPLGFILLMVLLIVTFRRRAQSAKGAGK